MSNKKNKQGYEKKPNVSNKQNSGKKQNVKKAQEIKKAQEMKREQRNKKIFGVSVAACAAVILIVSLVVIHGNNKDNSDSSAFSYSEGIDENGFWEDINALDYVEIFNYQSLSIPSDAYQISDGDLQSAIDTLLANYAPEEKQVMDRAVADGDKVNIDYVGSVDGVEFEGGSTGGEGADVTAGDTDYIDDFLTQIIGHMPGETINVEVTFPDVYESNPDLAGKDAVFVTTINYIAETVLTDEFVEENLSGEYGWKTVREMEDGEREELKKAAIENYIKEYMQSDVTVSSVPDKLTEYQEASML
ncbi:MAG: FKBP-type peptidyl-prolyl cis-trans isomerase, partial [Clostridiales Family XIII bacterium]|nr:FKBP-type peptidyl-prolyl cis-trans isomerase [Clostridiales Family XIII bacterium]